MVTLLPGIAINSDTSTERTPPMSFRRIWATLFAQSSAGEPVPGRIPAPSAPLVVSGSLSAMEYNVSAGFAVTVRSGRGAYIVGTPTGVVVPTAAAHATLNRIDSLYIVQPDPELSEAGLPRIDVANGTPASSPLPPTLPAGALELARKIIVAGATNTSVGSTFSNIAPLTALNIGQILASQISDQQNINAGRIDGKKITVSNTGVAPVGPAVGDVWVDWS